MSVEFKKKVASGSFWSLLSSLGYQASGLVIFIFLSRFLSPADFGTVAIAIVFVEMLAIISRLGLSDIIVRQKDLTEEDKSTIFWVSLFTGGLSSTFIYNTAEIWESFFAAEGLASCLKALAVVPFIMTLFSVHEGLLRREFRFKEIAFRTVFASAFAGVVAVVLAFYDFGMYSLVAQRILTAVLSLTFLWIAVDWRPSFLFSIEKLKRHVSYGSSLMCSALLFTGMLKGIELTVGFFLGAASVGYLRIAGKLQDVIVQFSVKPLTDVSLSTFSKLQDQKRGLCKAYLRMVQLCSVLSFPAFVGLASLAPEVVDVVFGDKWFMSGQLMQVLCLGGISSGLNYFFAPMMNAIGQAAVIARVRLLQFVLTVLCVALGAQYGLFEAVIAFVLSTTVVMAITFIYLKRFIGLSIASLLKTVCPPLVAALGMGLGVYLSKGYVYSELHDILALIVCIAFGGMLYVTLFLVFFRKTFVEMKSAVVPLLKKRR